MKKSIVFLILGFGLNTAFSQSAPIQATLANPCAYLSVPEIKKPFDFVLFPNPNNGEFQLMVDPYFLDNDTQLSITDISGKEVFRMDKVSAQHGAQIPINLVDLKTGVYIVVLRTSNYMATKKLIINQ